MSALSVRLVQAKGDLSIDQISARAARDGHPIHRSVVAKYLAGDHGPRPPEPTLAGLAAGLGLDVRELRGLAGRPRGEAEPWVPPAVSASLTREQRKVLDALVLVMVNAAVAVDDDDAEVAVVATLPQRRR